jgi:hypothetical protein
MKHKSEARQHATDFRKLVFNQHNCKVKVVGTNNGPEFIIPSFYALLLLYKHTYLSLLLEQENAFFLITKLV